MSSRFCFRQALNTFAIEIMNALTSIDQLYQIFLEHPIVCTDSRALSPGCLFFALRGANFDGNQFAIKALEQGAAYAVVDDPKLQGDRLLHAPDTLKALQQLSTKHRLQFDIPIIAIGGSNGKTTTKELVSAILSSHYPCHFTKGNLNNQIGVPLTLLAMQPETEVAVIEMGTNQPGDILELCNIARPTHGLLTNIGKEHLEGFGNLAGVKKAEAELYHYLAHHKGCIFVNLSEKYLGAMTRRNHRKVCYMRTGHPVSYSGALEVQLLAEIPFIQAGFIADGTGEPIQVQSNLVGLHNFNNIMTAIALGIYFKVPAHKIRAAIEAYVPSNNRSQLIRNGSTTIILDAYNANPSSMAPSLETLRSLSATRKIAILGDMLELGENSDKEHAAILRLAARMKFDQLVLVGPAFGRTDFQKYKALHFPDAQAAKQWYNAQQLENTLVLLKGSRGIRLESILS